MTVLEVDFICHAAVFVEKIGVNQYLLACVNMCVLPYALGSESQDVSGCVFLYC